MGNGKIKQNGINQLLCPTQVFLFTQTKEQSRVNHCLIFIVKPRHFYQRQTQGLKDCPHNRCLKDSSRVTDCDKTFCLEATGLSILRTAQDSGSHSQRAAQEARRQLLLPQGKLVWTLAQALPTCGVLARQYSRYTPIPSRVTPEGTPGSGQAHGELPSLFSPSRGWHPSVCLSSQQRPFSASGP